MTAHDPDRATWRCVACAQEWPCPRRRIELLRGPSRVQLALDLARDLAEAILTLPEVPVSTLYLRFLGWVREAGPPAP